MSAIRSTKPKSGTRKAAPTAIRKPDKWTLMFYLAGDSDGISASMVSQLKELTDAGFQKHTNVLVYFDPNCNGKGARIYDVNHFRKKKSRKKTIIGDGNDPFVRNIGEDCHIQELRPMPAALTLRYFLDYARAYYGAENYMLFLMGHGVIVGNDAFLPDPDDNSAITLAELGWILNRFGRQVRPESEFHLVGFHSCSMSSVELASEIAGSARYMLGTQGAAFPGSWPYRQILKKIFNVIENYKPARAKDRKARDAKVAAEILRGLQDLSFYNSEDFWQAGYSADISMCSLKSKLVGALDDPLKKLSVALQAGMHDKDAKNCIVLAHTESQSYWNESYTDLVDFCSCLAKRCKGTGPQGAIRRACEKVRDVLTKRGSLSSSVVIHSDYYGPYYQFSNGLSIYFPWRSPAQSVLAAYQGYKFNQPDGKKGEVRSDSWLSFLNVYLKETRREARSWRKGYGSKNKNRGLSISLPPRAEAWLMTLSDRELLRLGRPPRGRRADPTALGPGKVGGDFGKVGGDFGKVGGDFGKVGGDFGKVGGDFGKVGGDFGKVGGDFGKVGGDFGKVGGDFGKVGGDFGKVGGDMGLYGRTVIKNFEDPPDKFVTSRRKKFTPAKGEQQSKKTSSKKRGRRTASK